MKWRFMLVFVTMPLLILSCKSADKPVAKGSSQAWPGQMQGMAQDVKKLLPFLYDKQAYANPKNRDQIRQHLKDFSQAAHQVNARTGQAFLGDDLLIEYSLNNLREDLNRALTTFDNGQLEYSRSVAKATMGHCFRCHSVGSAGASAAWDVEEVSHLSLAPLEKADLLVATRKFDKALTYMESMLNSPEFLKAYAFDFEAMLRRYLALIIRVENAPQRALSELDKILNRGETPQYIAQQAEGWRRSLNEWVGEKRRPPKSANGLLAQVEKRFKRAQGIQHYERDHAGDVEYLRATSMLHQGMKFLTEAEDQARALLWLGRAYEVLDELGSWNLHESYFEACLFKAPKSETAKKCYGRLEASLTMGYSGSAGTHLPPEEKERLRRLKEQLP
jgi:hypothetical protein